MVQQLEALLLHYGLRYSTSPLGQYSRALQLESAGRSTACLFSSALSPCFLSGGDADGIPLKPFRESSPPQDLTQVDTMHHASQSLETGSEFVFQFSLLVWVSVPEVIKTEGKKPILWGRQPKSELRHLCGEAS